MDWSQNVVNPVLHVVVVGFHHKKGCLVEYAYPPLLEGNSVASSECPKKWRHLPSLALPDGAHNFLEDTIYFHLPSLDEKQTTVFGVSCYQQINASEVLNKDEDVTRNTVQKSVCVLSKLPVFGLIQVKLEMITHAYFKGRDFSQVSLLKDTYVTLNSSITESLLQNSHIHLGLSGRELLRQFRHKLVVLFKLFLLEKKVLFFSSPVKPICTSILAIASLFPGLIEQGLFESAKFEAATLTPSPTVEKTVPFAKNKQDVVVVTDCNNKSIDNNVSLNSQQIPTDRLSSPTSESIAEIVDGRSVVVEKSTTSNVETLSQSCPLKQETPTTDTNLQQSKWSSSTLSQLRNRFFSSIMGSSSTQPIPPPTSSSTPLLLPVSLSASLPAASSLSLPSSPSSTDVTDTVCSSGNSMFYGNLLPPLKLRPKTLPKDSSTLPKDSSTLPECRRNTNDNVVSEIQLKNNNNKSEATLSLLDDKFDRESVIFIEAKSLSKEDVDKTSPQKSVDSLKLDQSNSGTRAPIHFSPPTSPGDKLPFIGSIFNADKLKLKSFDKISSTAKTLLGNTDTVAQHSSSSTFENKEHSAASVTMRVDDKTKTVVVQGSHALENVSDEDFEEMLADDDLVWGEEQHRLEISELSDDSSVHLDSKNEKLLSLEESSEIPKDVTNRLKEYDQSHIEQTKVINQSQENAKKNVKSCTTIMHDASDSVSTSPFVAGSDSFGLPLMIFSKGVLCHPYLSLHLYDVLSDTSVRGFVIGATNALFKQRRQLLDVIVELGDCRIDITDGELRKCLILSTADLRFAESLVRTIDQEKGDPFLDNTGWEGGDDWIRSQFRAYLISLLATVDQGDEKSQEDFNSAFVAAWKTTNNYASWKQGSPRKSLSSVTPQHVCHGQLSMSDVRLKINQVINNGNKDKKLTAVVNQTVSQTGRAVGAAVGLAKSTVSSWFSGFSAKE